MLNNLNLIGRLTKELELKKSVNNKSYVAFNLAVNNGYNNEVDFIPCFAWNKIAENMTKYLQKGSLIAVSGKIHSQYVANEGYSLLKLSVVANNVVFLNSPKNISNEDIPSNNLPEPIADNQMEKINFDGDDAILWD